MIQVESTDSVVLASSVESLDQADKRSVKFPNCVALVDCFALEDNLIISAPLIELDKSVE